MQIIDLGLIPYGEAEQKQAEAVAAVQAGEEETLFLLEHPPVITFGRNGGEENLPFGRAFFEVRGVDVVRTTRGGNITCHFPGQLVAYPVMRVSKRPGGLKQFFFDMEESVIRTLADFGFSAERMQGRPGVWVGERKICSTGIAVKHWITCHGLSLNVAADLSLFDQVTPCGLPGVSATSVHRELGNGLVSMDMVKAGFIKNFTEVFNTGE